MMRRMFYMILCGIKNVKWAIHCKMLADDLSINLSETHWNCEFVGVNDAFHLMGLGFEPSSVRYENPADYDHFYFKRTPALLMALDAYHKKIRDAVSAVDFDNLMLPCEIPGSKISPEDSVAIDNTIAPIGHVKERFAYESWPKERRQAYIAAGPDERRNMIDAAYNRG